MLKKCSIWMEVWCILKGFAAVFGLLPWATRLDGIPKRPNAQRLLWCTRKSMLRVLEEQAHKQNPKSFLGLLLILLRARGLREQETKRVPGILHKNLDGSRSTKLLYRVKMKLKLRETILMFDFRLVYSDLVCFSSFQTHSYNCSNYFAITGWDGL